MWLEALQDHDFLPPACRAAGQNPLCITGGAARRLPSDAAAAVREQHQQLADPYRCVLAVVEVAEAAGA
jgi:hypothetical protein